MSEIVCFLMRGPTRDERWSGRLAHLPRVGDVVSFDLDGPVYEVHEVHFALSVEGEGSVEVIVK